MKTLGLFFVCISLTCFAQTPAQTAALRKFAEDVCLKKLSGNDQRVVRYTTSPAISLYNDADPAAKEIFDAAVSEFNEALAPASFALSPSPPRNAEAPIRVVYCTRDQFVQACKNHRVTPEGTRNWVSWYWWDRYHRIERSLAVITFDPAKPDEIARSTRQALMLSIGFGNFTAEPVPSVLSSSATERAKKLTDYDRSLVSFFIRL
jgi:hypothetical protein